MIAKLAKLLLILACIPLLTACELVLPLATLGTPVAQWVGYNADVKDNTSYISGSDYTLWATYNKDFSTQLNLSNISNVSNVSNISNISNINNISYFAELQDKNINNTKCPKVNLTVEIASTFYMNFNEPLSSKKINISILNKTQSISNYVPIIIYSKTATKYDKGELGLYSLENAINYQWCQGVFKFDNQYVKNDTHSKNLSYMINLSILSENKSCEKSVGNQCLVIHYKYDINVVNNETNKIYFNKKLEYTENTSYVLGGIAYNPLNYYVSLIVYKNRYVIDEQVFTDELYNTLHDALQNATSYVNVH